MLSRCFASCAVLALSALLVSVDAHALPAATVGNPADLTVPGGDGLFGFQFSPTADIMVTHLGLFDTNSDGLTSAHEVGLWREDQALLASVSVAAGGTPLLMGGFRYEAITPITLFASETYRVAALYEASDPDFSNFDILPLDTHSFDPAVGWIDAVSFGSSVLAFPTGGPASVGSGFNPSSVLGGSFLFEIVPVPEPGALALLGLGLFALSAFSRRSGTDRELDPLA